MQAAKYRELILPGNQCTKKEPAEMIQLADINLRVSLFSVIF